MFIRQAKRTYKGKTYVNYLLVDSFRTEKGPRQKTICSLGDLSPRSAKEWLKLAHKVESALVGQVEIFSEDEAEVQEIVTKVKARQTKVPQRRKTAGEDLVCVHTDQVRTEEHRAAGSVHVGVEFWKRLQLDRILSGVGMTVRAQNLTLMMVMNRLISPSSENAMPDWIRSTALGDILDEDLDKLKRGRLYRNLDRLHPARAQIESELWARERTLYSLDDSVFLYDLTSTYFEGEAEENEKAKRGYSRDKRPDCKQVVIGLVVNRDGFPVAHEVFEGNTQDRKTVGAMLDLLASRGALRSGATVVVDRGMAYPENLKQIRDRKLHYLVASRQGERDQWFEEFESGDRFEEVIREVSPRNEYQQKSSIRVKMKDAGRERHVLCLSSGREEKDRAIREKQESRLRRDLDKLMGRVSAGKLKDEAKVGEAIGRLKERYPRVAKYHEIRYESATKQVVHEVREEKRRKAEELDGSYMLKTDRGDLSADEAIRIYLLLTRAEAAFRAMKSPLGERPIFHHVVKRVEAHIFLCVLAYHLLIAIEKTLRDKGEHTSWATVREKLATHVISTVVLPADNGMALKIRRPSTPEPEHTRLYELLKVQPDIIRPKKTWVRNQDDLGLCSD